MRLGCGLSAFAISVALTCAGAAQDRAPAEAEGLFREGREEFKQGNTDAACRKFSESHRIQPAAGPLLNIARCDEEVYARLASAWRHYQEALALLPCGDDRLELVKARIAALDPRVPRLLVRLGGRAPAETRILLDGVNSTVDPGTPVRVDPGERVIVASAPGRQPREVRVLVREGQSLSVTLEPGEPVVPTDSPERLSAKRTNRIIGYSIGGVGLAAIVGASVSEIVLASKNSTVSDNCDNSRRCNEAGLDAANSGRTLTTIDRILWGVGLAGVAAGAYLVWTNRGEDAPAVGIQARAVPGGAAALVGGAF
jgi:hypothetical protein